MILEQMLGLEQIARVGCTHCFGSGVHVQLDVDVFMCDLSVFMEMNSVSAISREVSRLDSRRRTSISRLVRKLSVRARTAAADGGRALSATCSRAST